MRGSFRCAGTNRINQNPKKGYSLAKESVCRTEKKKRSALRAFSRLIKAGMASNLCGILRLMNMAACHIVLHVRNMYALDYFLLGMTAEMESKEFFPSPGCRTFCR
jgi:hypothetical protein